MTHLTFVTALLWLQLTEQTNSEIKTIQDACCWITISMVLPPTLVLHPGFVPEKFGVTQKGISK